MLKFHWAAIAKGEMWFAIIFRRIQSPKKSRNWTFIIKFYDNIDIHCQQTQKNSLEDGMDIKICMIILFYSQSQSLSLVLVLVSACLVDSLPLDLILFLRFFVTLTTYHIIITIIICLPITCEHRQISYRLLNSSRW